MNENIGKLYIVATPIGNLGDMTHRGIQILNDVELILCEDTRVSRKLLQKYEIDTNISSYRDQNHMKILPQVTEIILRGGEVALISDAGTPLISDPGFKLVEYVYEIGGDVISAPGPSSVISALAASGLPTDSFIFLGFAPKKEGKMTNMLVEAMSSESTSIIFESPFRIKKLLKKITEINPEQIIAVVNDQTKMYECIWRDESKTVYDDLESIEKPKGEFIVLIAKKSYTISKISSE